jgi:hypothetical protein
MSRRAIPCSTLAAAAVLFTASAALAQSTLQLPPGMPSGPMPPRDTSQKTGTARIRGRVVAADSGQPLRKVQVRATAPELRDNRMTSTGADGGFELKELPAGRYNLTASKGGYVQLQYGQTRPFSSGKPIELRDGETIEKVDFALPRGGVVTGRVVDEYGDPLTDVSVALERYQYSQGRRRLAPSGRPAMTNDIGEYRLFGLPPGQYYLSATFRTGPMADSDDRSGYAPTFYPGTPNAAEAQRISIGIGQTLNEMNLTLVPARTVRVSGTALDSSGKPFSGGGIIVTQASGGGFMATMGAQIKPDGTFTLTSVAPGEYTLRAQPLGPTGGFGPMIDTPESAIARITVGSEDISGLLLAANKPVAVTGRIVIPAGASFQPAAARLIATPGDSDIMPFGPPGGGKINDDLTFEMKVPPGHVLVRLIGRTAGDWVTKSQRLNGVDVVDTGIEVRPGEDITGLEIELTNQQSQITGGVTDSRGQTVKDYSVVVFARDREKWTLPQTRYIRQSQADQAGRFKVTGLPAGEYYAIAVDYIEAGEANDPELLDRVKDRATAFTLDDGGTKVLDLKLSSTS